MDVAKKNIMSDKINNAIMVNGSVENMDKSPDEKSDHANLDSSDEISIKTEKNSLHLTPNSSKIGETLPSKATSPVCDVAPEEMKSVLKQELETIFSQENFSKDKFLISQLDSDHYVSLSIIMQLKPIERLTRNADLILQLLKELPNLQVDTSNTKVRLATPRSTIILREVPQTTPKEVIERLFDSVGCPPCVRCEFAGNENWYVTFLNEDDAHRAYNHLRENVQHFLGKPIMARIKTSNTFISSSNKATSSGSTGRFHRGAPAGVDVIQQNHQSFSSQNSALLSNYFISQPFPFYSPELISAQMWQQKLMEPYNLSMCQDLMYSQPFYGYHSQDGAASFDGNSRQHKSSNSVHFRSGNHNYQSQHRSQSDYGGGHYQRHGGSHGENKPPPRFLRQQLASMASSSSDVMSVEIPSFNHLNVDSCIEKNSSDSRPVQNQQSTKPTFTSNDNNRHVPNGFVKGTPSCKLPDDKERDGYPSRGKRFPERRGGFRGNRRSRNIEEGDKNVKTRQQETSQKSPKSKDAPTFLLESSSFPPLSSNFPPLSSNSNASPTPPTSSHCSYVQAVANSSSAVVPPPFSSQINRSPHVNRVINNSSPSFTASKPFMLNSNCDINGAADGDSKMPSHKLSYAQIAQRTRSNDDSLDVFASGCSTRTADCDGNSPGRQPPHHASSWSRKKPARKNVEALKASRVVGNSLLGDDKQVNDSKKNVERCELFAKASPNSLDDALSTEERFASLRIDG